MVLRISSENFPHGTTVRPAKFIVIRRAVIQPLGTHEVDTCNTDY